MNDPTFQPGDILLHGGESYQLLEDRGDHGLVIPFPGDSTIGIELRWDEAVGCRRIGNAPLPAPTPCSTDGCCPTNGNPLSVDDVCPKR